MALLVGDQWIMVYSIAILAVCMLRVSSALFYLLYKEAQRQAATKFWEHFYVYGAWGFSALLGLLCWLSITPTVDASLQLAVTSTSAVYAVSISVLTPGGLSSPSASSPCALCQWPSRCSPIPIVCSSAGLRVAVFHLLFDFYLSQYPRHHHSGSDYDAQEAALAARF